MQEQLSLIHEVAWDVLIILDACRADYFHAVVGPSPVVKSAATHTRGWIQQVAPFFSKLNALYFTANPVIDRELRKGRHNIELISVWERLWWRHTDKAIPSIHPFCVDGVVATYEELDKLEGRRVVVHYTQPHAPYIGSIPLGIGRSGHGHGPLWEACVRELMRPAKAINRGEMSWKLVRHAYRANLKLVWRATQLLNEVLAPCKVIVTADHGEMLGEDGMFGHEGSYGGRKELWEVPWLELPPPSEQNSTQGKLEALGYV